MDEMSFFPAFCSLFEQFSVHIQRCTYEFIGMQLDAHVFIWIQVHTEASFEIRFIFRLSTYANARNIYAQKLTKNERKHGFSLVFVTFSCFERTYVRIILNSFVRKN